MNLPQIREAAREPMKKYCKTLDPEIAVSQATNDTMYPYSRTFSIGADITF